MNGLSYSGRIAVAAVPNGQKGSRTKVEDKSRRLWWRGGRRRGGQARHVCGVLAAVAAGQVRCGRRWPRPVPGLDWDGQLRPVSMSASDRAEAGTGVGCAGNGCVWVLGEGEGPLLSWLAVLLSHSPDARLCWASTPFAPSQA